MGAAGAGRARGGGFGGVCVCFLFSNIYKKKENEKIIFIKNEPNWDSLIPSFSPTHLSFPLSLALEYGIPSTVSMRI